MAGKFIPRFGVTFCKQCSQLITTMRLPQL